MIIDHRGNLADLLEWRTNLETADQAARLFRRDGPVVGAVCLRGLADYIGVPPALDLSLSPEIIDSSPLSCLVLYGRSWHIRFICPWRTWSKLTGYVDSDLWSWWKGVLDLAEETPHSLLLRKRGEVEDISIHFRSGIVLDIFSLRPLYSWIFESRPFQISNSSEILHVRGESPIMI